MNRWYIFLILFSQSAYIYASYDTLQIINEKYSNMIEDMSEDEDSEYYFEIIDQLLTNPVDLNNSDKNELLQIPFFSPNDIDLIIKERKRRKGFKSLNELLSIKDLHPDLILLVKPFLTITENSKNNKSIDKIFTLQYRSRLLSDLQVRKGYANDKFTGNKIKSYNRIKVQTGDLKFGIITEKDAGEVSYFDHYAGFMQYSLDGIINKILIGDYNFEFGQGLALWSPYSFSKGSDAVNTLLRSERNFTPHLSSEENKFFRGAALLLNFNSFYLSGFYSNKNLDGSLNGQNEIINLTSTGYHRTENELSNKRNVREISLGGTIHYHSNFFSVGFLHFQNQFNYPFTYTNQNNFWGDKFSFTSISLNLFLKDFHAVNEYSYNGYDFAHVSKLFIHLTDNISLTAAYRNYSPKYFNFYANGFGEFGNTQNETGFYLGTKLRTAIGTFNIYYDIFKAPSQSYYSYFPINGNDLMLNFISNLNKGNKLYLKIKHENKEVLTKGNLRETVDNENKTNYRVELKYKLSKYLSGKSRIEMVVYSNKDETEKGYLTYQELKYRIQNNYSISTRIIFFQTESYDSRIYEFENDLIGSMTNLPMFGEGFRWYILFAYKIFHSFSISLKYSDTYKPLLRTISSGNSEIMGNVDNRISFQLDYKL